MMWLLAMAAWTDMAAPSQASAAPPRLIAGTIAHSDYPKAALREYLQGRVEALLTINEKGLVSACAIRRSSGYKLLDDTTCRLVLVRYRFDPARNAEGRPVTVHAVLPVEWTIP